MKQSALLKALGVVFWVLVVLVIVLLVGCEANVPPEIDTDNGLTWNNTSDDLKRSLVDTELYLFTIQVGRGTESVTYQAEPGYGSGTMYGNYASMSYRSEVINGKGVIVGTILRTDHPDVAAVGNTLLFKFSDLKAVILQPGDIVEVKCRRDFEALSPVLDKQDWQPTSVTWELDLCRLSNPTLELAE